MSQREVEVCVCGDHLAHQCCQQVVDDVPTEEEGVDEAAVLVAEGLGGDGRLGGVGA